MRTLVVDNHDSFTQNLVHALAVLGGRRPDVVRNDEPWSAVRLADYDNVVVGPGPGHPATPRDLGISRAVLELARQPLLGVCLGHQGLCLLAGAEVGPAPQVRHGRLSAVRHDGRELFAGIPSPTEVVRYHSLAVRGVPAELEATAWSDDGVLMGVRHRHRPAWGVQFHPESIRTEHGLDLLANFQRMSTAAPRPREVIAARARPARLRVVSRSLTLPLTAEDVHAELYRDSPHAFWLDSTTQARFDFLGDAGGPRARVAAADVTTGLVTVTHSDGRVEVVDRPFLDWLDDDLAAHRATAPDLPFGFTPGWVGYLGYELKAECGAAAAHTAPDPDAQLVFADRAVAVDNRTGELHLLAFAGDEGWLDATADRLARVVPRDHTPATTGVTPLGPLTARHDRDAYLARIAECHRVIDLGESYEVCLTNQLTAAAEVDVLAAYRHLRRASPAPFGALLRFGPLSVLSTSPERFLSVSAAGEVESRPIKGTRPRGSTAEQDAALRADLAASEKDLAENLMIVDLVRNDLGATADTGSVSVPGLFEVETYATVHQLVSTVRARLAADRTPVDCVRAAFPGGSMTGAPKERTMEVLDRLEGGPRGVYSGAIGYFACSGAVDLSIAIRTLVVRPGELSWGVGGAVTALSDPDAEFEETAVKATAVLDLLGARFPGRVAT
ncbi:aminodeoxychorismate synthase component I [Actinokineospora bangkokensis]|uniref:aminodeoxychorismate synthase n=1 Tax=Actinokineospora bangkokensis TaxID=1193682 RepID=A0A1Q9LRM1_9PSEU|nr:aminodeoxychorismate synthase component I [Actinokineospora bangkokensis]OLR94641.1 aminodeoxychorismate synthase, component I [Actinokineospora bangkokensis]